MKLLVTLGVVAAFFAAFTWLHGVAGAVALVFLDRKEPVDVKVGRNGPKMGTRHLFSAQFRSRSKVAWKTGTCPHFASNDTWSKPDFDVAP